MGKKRPPGKESPRQRGSERTHVIRSVKQLQALRTPLRQQLLANISLMEPCSVADLAAQVRKPAGSLYYHIKQLCAAGLIQVAGRRRAGRRWENLYAPVAPRIRIDTTNRSRRFLDEFRQARRSLLRATERDLQQTLEWTLEQGGDPSQTTLVRRLNMRLRPQAAAQFRKKLKELEAFVADNDDPSASESLVFTFVWYQLPQVDP